MALPLSIFTPQSIPTAFQEPDDRDRPSLLVDYEFGGVAIGDPSLGLQHQIWEARVDSGAIQTRPEGVGGWTTITTDGGEITEISLAFDQNMRPSVAFMSSGLAKHYWYDAQIEDFTTSIYADATSPVVSMDDKRERQVGFNDIVLFYILNGRCIYRRQRDRFLNVIDMGPIPSGATRILRWGMSVGNRFQLEFNRAEL